MPVISSPVIDGAPFIAESPDETTDNTQSTHPTVEEDLAEEEVMSPRPRPAQTSGTDAGMERHVDEQLSKRDHCRDSQHSPNVAESPCPRVFADTGSAWESPSGGADGPDHYVCAPEGMVVDLPALVDPNYDPLAKWFEVHFQLLHCAGKPAAAVSS